MQNNQTNQDKQTSIIEHSSKIIIINQADVGQRADLILTKVLEQCDVPRKYIKQIFANQWASFCSLSNPQLTEIKNKINNPIDNQTNQTIISLDKTTQQFIEKTIAHNEIYTQKLKSHSRIKSTGCLILSPKLFKETTIKENQSSAYNNVQLNDGMLANVANESTHKPLQAQKIKLNIVFEDHDILVINKPAQMSSHASSHELTDTLVNGLIYYLKDNLAHANDPFRPGIVHRLDKNTSGLMIIAKNNKAHKILSQQFSQTIDNKDNCDANQQEHKFYQALNSKKAFNEQFQNTSKAIKRHYYAFVIDKPSYDYGIINLNLTRDKNNKTKIKAVDKNLFRKMKIPNSQQQNTETYSKKQDNYYHKNILNAQEYQQIKEEKYHKPARTYYNTLETFYFNNPQKQFKYQPCISKLDCQLDTGRTHQIRVHLEAMKCPLLCDDKYGRQFISKFQHLPSPIINVINEIQPANSLHAYYLEFVHPINNQSMTFNIELPEYLKKLENCCNNLTKET